MTDFWPIFLFHISWKHRFSGVFRRYKMRTSVKTWSHGQKWVKKIQRVRSSHRKCSRKNCVLKNLAKFTTKHLCESLFFNKVTGLRLAILLRKRLWHRSFPVKFAKSLGTIILINICEWLLLESYTWSICVLWEVGRSTFLIDTRIEIMWHFHFCIVISVSMLTETFKSYLTLW